MNKLDQFVKRELKEKQYIRYCDDFVILSDTKEDLENKVQRINDFLCDTLGLALHEKKIIIREFRQGIDFLGYVILPQYRVLRTKTKRRIFKKLSERKIAFERGEISDNSFRQSFQSYLGVLSHADTYILREELVNRFLLNS